MPAAWCVNPSMFRVTVTVPSAIHTIPLVVIDAPSILEMTGAPKGCCLGTRGPNQTVDDSWFYTKKQNILRPINTLVAFHISANVQELKYQLWNASPCRLLMQVRNPKQVCPRLAVSKLPLISRQSHEYYL